MATQLSLKYAITGNNHSHRIGDISINDDDWDIYFVEDLLDHIQEDHNRHCKCGTQLARAFKVELDADEPWIDVPRPQTDSAGVYKFAPYDFVYKHFPTKPPPSIISIVCDSCK